MTRAADPDGEEGDVQVAQFLADLARASDAPVHADGPLDLSRVAPDVRAMLAKYGDGRLIR